jgi:hypothetical protein
MPNWAEDGGLPAGSYFKEEGVEEQLYRENGSGKVWHLKNGILQPVGVKHAELKESMGAKKEGAKSGGGDGSFDGRPLSKLLSEADAKKSLDK